MCHYFRHPLVVSDAAAAAAQLKAIPVFMALFYDFSRSVAYLPDAHTFSRLQMAELWVYTHAGDNHETTTIALSNFMNESARHQVVVVVVFGCRGMILDFRFGSDDEIGQRR